MPTPRTGTGGWVAAAMLGSLFVLLIGRLGQVQLIEGLPAPRAPAAVTRTVAEPVISRLPGQHGSLSAEEQLVPLLIHPGAR